MWLRFVYEDGSEKDLEVGKFTSIKANPAGKVRLHIDQLPDGKHLVIADESILKVDGKRQIVSKLRRIEVVRSDG
jgi:hypothetical protein